MKKLLACATLLCVVSSSVLCMHKRKREDETIQIQLINQIEFMNACKQFAQAVQAGATDEILTSLAKKIHDYPLDEQIADTVIAQCLPFSSFSRFQTILATLES